MGSIGLPRAGGGIPREPVKGLLLFQGRVIAVSREMIEAGTEGVVRQQVPVEIVNILPVQHFGRFVDAQPDGKPAFVQFPDQQAAKTEDLFRGKIAAFRQPASHWDWGSLTGLRYLTAMPASR